MLLLFKPFFVSSPLDTRNLFMNGCDIHSLKPFLLDSILAWSTMQRFTPILLTSAHPERELPPALSSMAFNPLAFKLTDTVIRNRSITTEQLSFQTCFPPSPVWETVVLPIDSWISLRVNEIPYVFDFSFPEHLLAEQNGLLGFWPAGIFTQKSSLPINSGDARERDSSVATPVLRSCKRRPALSLVWSDGGPVGPRS